MRKLPLLLLLVILLQACTKTETNYYHETGKNLVIISDNTPSSDLPVTSFGSPCLNPQKFIVQHPLISGDTLKGEILFTDNFGNCITDIPKELTSGIAIGTLLNCRVDTTHLTITMGFTYSTVNVGENVCFVNGSQRLQLSVNYGNFSTKYHATASSKVFLIK